MPPQDTSTCPRGAAVRCRLITTFTELGFWSNVIQSTFAANFYSNFNQKQLQTYQVHDEDFVQKTQAAQVVHK